MERSKRKWRVNPIKVWNKNKRKERKGEGRRGRQRKHGEIDSRGRVFVSFGFRATGKTAGWDMVEWRKGLGTGRCGMNAPHVDCTLRGEHLPGEQLGSHQCEGWGGREEGRLPGDHNLSSRLGHVVQATASRTAGNNDSYDWYAIKTRKFEIQIFISSNLPRLKNKKPKSPRLKFLHFYYFKYDAIPIISKLHSSTFLIKQTE